MSKIQSYEDSMKIELMQSTPYPAEMVALAQDITMSAREDKDIPQFTENKARFLIRAEHTSLFEHVVYTFLIQGVSRSFLAQITRQRMASPTSGSQHYQDYSDYPCAVHEDLVDNAAMNAELTTSFGGYSYMVQQEGVLPEEARQALPNAACVNYLWTINAHSLMWFLRKRLCYRNVREMQLFSTKVREIVIDHFPELFNNVGPQCYMDADGCKQGFLQCDHGAWLP